jgi:ribosomal protein S18 acetylase RimI-like enzyme
VATVRYQEKFSWLAMLLVDPEERRGGIGTALLFEGLRLLQEQDCVRLDATPLGKQLYQKHGFRDEYMLYRMALGRGVYQSTTFSGSKEPGLKSSSAVRRMRDEDLPAVFERDREIFGADRSFLLRDLFERSPNFAWVAGENTVLGYCLSRPGSLYRQLGPLVAEAPSIAADLLEDCLAVVDGPVVIDVPALPAQQSWVEALTRAGFAQERTFLRMCRGYNGHPGKPHYLFGSVGPEFG